MIARICSGAVSLLFVGYTLIMGWATMFVQTIPAKDWPYQSFTQDQFFTAMFAFLTATSVGLAAFFAYLATERKPNA